tara:strand:+ start:1457 stop:2512 length:1056 start_codon:yes stop_codon:yes gene_type:complete
MGDYGSETQRINDLIQQTRESTASSISQTLDNAQSSATTKWTKEGDEYLAKYQTLAQGGGADIAGALGLEGVWRGGKKVKDLYDSYQKAKSVLNKQKLVDNTDSPTDVPSETAENLSDGRVGGVPDVEPKPQTGEAPEISTDDFTSKDAFDFIRTEGQPDVPLTQKTPQAQEETPEVEETSFMDRPPPALSEEEAQGEFPRISASDAPPQATAPAPVEDLDEPEDKFEDAPEEPAENVIQQTTEQTLKKGGEDLLEKGGESLVEKAAGSGLGELAFGAVPVVGEIALGVAGIVSIGEGLYHLFHHKDKAPVVNQTPTGTYNNVSNTLTQKYAMALPSIDASSDVPASISSF